MPPLNAKSASRVFACVFTSLNAARNWADYHATGPVCMRVKKHKDNKLVKHENYNISADDFTVIEYIPPECAMSMPTSGKQAITRKYLSAWQGHITEKEK